jgi:aminoglycoside phosphotransferase (APT) family kinase protein
MLSPADAQLVRRDTQLPGLGVLLDADAFAERLARQSPELGIESLALTYVRYKPGTNCIADYHVRTSDGETRLHAKAYSPEATAKLNKAAVYPAGASPPECRALTLEALHIVALPFPLDPMLPVLARLAGPERNRLLARILRTPDAPVDGELTALAYKPQRRYVCRLDRADSAPAVLRFYASHERHRAARTAARLVSDDILALPRRIGGSKRHQAHAFEWLPGVPLRELLDADAAPRDVLLRVGHALAALHARDAKLAAPAPGRRSEQLREIVRTLDVLAPFAATLTQRVAAQLARVRPDTGGGAQPVHGDLYDKQILIDGDRVGLIDLDDASLGRGADDIGLFVAHLERAQLLRLRSAERTQELVQTTLAGYRERSGADLPGLDAAVAEGLVRLAHHPFRNRQPDWPEATQRILARAGELLGLAC